jgi:hypothetical protein
MQAPCGLGHVQVLDVNALNTLHSDIINIYSSSSYELSKFLLKAGSACGGGQGLAQGGSSGASMSDHFLKLLPLQESLKTKVV